MIYSIYPSLRGTKQSRNLTCIWIASQARNDGELLYRHCELAKQSSNLICAWIASQATNDESCLTSLRACEAIQNLTGAPGLLRRLAMTGDQRHLHLFDFSSGSRNDDNPVAQTGHEPPVKYRTLPDADRVFSSLPFISDSLCYIKDPSHSMSVFINLLMDLLHGKDTVINVVHLGDSHIQAGHLSGRTMRLLQNSFGNAGRGWIAPFKLAKTNEPSDYYITSNVKEWIAGRCVQTNPKCPWGIGGIGIQTKTKDVDFRVIITPGNGEGYSFNKVLLYSDCNASPLTPVNNDRVVVSSSDNQPNDIIRVDTFLMANPADTLAIRSKSPQNQSGNSNLYYGFNLMNGNPGILYHAIGVNGAHFVNYAHRDYIRQLALLQPSLLIISLGGNEAHGRNFNKTTFERQVHSLIRLIREEIPGTAILITTPAETYKSVYVNKKRQYVRNENIAKVAEVISAYTEREGLACWDLFTVSGGENSCKNWYDAKVLGSDRIHFSYKGYEEQGLLLFKAIARTCVLPIASSEIKVNTRVE